MIYEGMNITSVINDSRLASPGALFVCLIGANSDGHDYIDDCYNRGVRAFAVMKDVSSTDYPGAVFKHYEDTRQALAELSAQFYCYPASEMIMIGITGTKGKTSTSFMLASIFNEANIHAAVIGTTGIYYAGKEYPTNNTTPNSSELHRFFREFRDNGCKTVIMEVSSQGIKQCRTYGILFDYGVFLNLTPDHIQPGEHENFEEYKMYKSMLFAQCKKAYANADDPNCADVTATFNGKPLFFGIQNGNVFAHNIRPSRINNRFGINFYIEQSHFTLSMPGEYSVYNALSAVCIARDMGVSEEHIAAGLERAVVKGRFEPVDVSAPFGVIIDYAHNAASMKNLLTAVKKYSLNKIIIVFGAGGNRARERRFDMGRIAGEFCDLSVLTSDNPRDEELTAIINDILTGIKPTGGAYEIIHDRKAAIHKALSTAGEGDIVLIVGKGHQCYEEIKGVKYPFDDREAVLSFFHG